MMNSIACCGGFPILWWIKGWLVSYKPDRWENDDLVNLEQQNKALKCSQQDHMDPGTSQEIIIITNCGGYPIGPSR